MDVRKEIALIRKAIGVLFLKRGLFVAVLGWLALLGNLGTIKQVSALSFDVLNNDAQVVDAFVWFAVLFVFIIVTPKILSFNIEAEEFFIKFYTVIINSVFSLGFIYCLFVLMKTEGYIELGECLKFTECHFNPLDDFNYINSLLLIFAFLWIFALYINRLLPGGYLNYASSPLFIVVCVAVIFASFSDLSFSINYYFNNNQFDAFIRLFISLLVISGFMFIVRKTVFSSLSSQNKLTN